jgi:hypothetical protein
VFGAAVAGAASRIAEVLDRHPVLPGPYPLPEVLRELAAQQAALQDALEAYPLALAVGEDGRPDPLGPDLASLMGQVLYVLVLFHNLEDIPDRLRVQAHRNLSAAHLRARHVRDRGPRRSRASAASDFGRGGTGGPRRGRASGPPPGSRERSD